MLEMLDTELHQLAQPLTALQCRLELGQIQGDPESLREAVRDALTEMQRVSEILARVRELLMFPRANP